MVDNVQPRSLSCFRIRKRRHENRNGSTKSEHPRASQHDLGWRARRTTSLLPVAGVVFSLDSPLYRTRLPDKLVYDCRICSRLKLAVFTSDRNSRSIKGRVKRKNKIGR